MSETTVLPHQILFGARTASGLTVEKIAADLNLPVAVIKAIDEGRYDCLYGDAFIAGVIRAYAGLLQLDASSLVLAYKQSKLPDTNNVGQAPESLAVAAHLSLQHKKYRTGYGILAVLVLVVISAVFSSSGDLLQEQKAEPSITIETAIGTTIVNSLDDLPQVNPTQDILPEIMSFTLPLSNTLNDDGIEQSMASNDVSVPSDTAALSSLSFTFSADCWVEILDGNNRKVFSALQKAEQRLDLTGKPPFRITLGYAPGVALSYNSQPVAISVDDSNMAILVLGNT